MNNLPQFPPLRPLILTAFLFGGPGSCAKCEPCPPYTVGDFSADEDLPDGEYAITLTLDGVASMCTIVAEDTSMADPCDDIDIEMDIRGPDVIYTAIDGIFEHIQIEVEHLPSGTRWEGSVETDTLQSPRGFENCSEPCDYALGEGTLVLVD